VNCEHFPDFIHVKAKKHIVLVKESLLYKLFFLMNFYNDYNQFRIDLIVKDYLFGGEVQKSIVDPQAGRHFLKCDTLFLLYN
jgi:hypothetical protein